MRACASGRSCLPAAPYHRASVSRGGGGTVREGSDPAGLTPLTTLHWAPGRWRRGRARGSDPPGLTPTQYPSRHNTVLGRPGPECLDVIDELIGEALNGFLTGPRDVRCQNDIRPCRKLHQWMVR